jgi:hypothetical protein
LNLLPNSCKAEEPDMDELTALMPQERERTPASWEDIVCSDETHTQVPLTGHSRKDEIYGVKTGERCDCAR